VEYEVVPEPSPAEREALLAALAARPTSYDSEWRRLGIDSALTPVFLVEPRIRRGATRA
jgi:hypothetical protein